MRIFKFILFCILSFSAFAGISKMSSDLGLTNQAGFAWYNGADAPEGGYTTWMYSGTNSLTGTIPLGQTVVPGNNYVLVKVYTYEALGTVSVALGGDYSTVTLTNSDWNRYWSTVIPVTAVSGVSNLTLRVNKTLSPSSPQNYLVLGVHVSTNQYENLPANGRDWIVDWTPPQEPEATNVVKGNIIENSSFEVGAGHGFGFVPEVDGREFPFTSHIVTNQAYHGQNSFRFWQRGILYSKIYTLKRNRRHTLSMWAKADLPVGVSTIQLGLYSASGNAPSGYEATKGKTNTFSIGNTWTRIAISNTLPAYPNFDYQFYISSSGTNNYIDAVQFEEGDISDYAPNSVVEIGITSTNIGHIFSSGDALTLESINYSAPFSGYVPYEIYDVFNKVVTTNLISVNLDENTNAIIEVILPEGKTGIFRMMAWVSNYPGTLEEYSYAVLPAARTNGIDTNSMFGIHPNLNSGQLATMNRLGIKWGRMLSPETIFRWSVIEPTEGNITFYDEKVSRASTNGQTLLATIGSNNYWPAWANNGGVPDLDKWGSFVSRLVTHYTNSVKYWEIWNEPIYNFTTNFYAQLLERAAVEIRAVDPDAKIVGMGGVYDYTWIVKVMALLGDDWTNSLDVVSTHLYADDYNEPSGGETDSRALYFKTNVIDAFSVDLWMTESGIWDEGFYKTRNASDVNTGTPLWPHMWGTRYVNGSYYSAEALIANVIHCLGNGMKKYFYYDSRVIASPSYHVSHPTILEYDDSIRSKGVAYAICAHFIDGSTAVGQAVTNIWSYTFDRDGIGTSVIWAKDNGNHYLSNVSGLNPYDLMGNPIPLVDGAIPFGRTQVYLVATNLTGLQVMAEIADADILDVADTNPPSLTVDIFPQSQPTSNSERFAWIGVDDVSIPSGVETDLVQYSYRLEGLSEWSDYSPISRVSYGALSEGAYSFQVKTKDASGNISEVVSREFVLGDAKINPTISWTGSTNLTYPATLTASATATWAEEEVAGEFAFSPTNGASLNSGTQTVTITFNPTDTDTYNPVSTTATVVVVQGDPEFLATQLVSSLSHPASFDTNYFSPSSVQDATFSFSKAQGAALRPGNNSITASCSPVDTNYFQTNISFTITVTGVEGGKARLVQSTNHPIGRLIEK